MVKAAKIGLCVKHVKVRINNKNNTSDDRCWLFA
jgi:hypothetical protein